MAVAEIREDEAPVLIVGGGLVGLSAAMFLAQYGIRSITIERLKTTSPLPRAAHFHMRTLELFRAAGIEQAVREQSEREFVPEGTIVAMDSLAGKVLAQIIPSLNEGVDAVSPCRRLFVTQPGLEPILRRRAREAGATVIDGAEVSAVAQDKDGVRATIRDLESGETRELRGRYLIAADGGHSRVREQLGIGFSGRGTFSNSLTIYFKGDLSRQIADNPWSVIYINNPKLGGFFRLDRDSKSGFFAINTIGDPKADPAAAANAAADVSEPRLVELVRIGAGVPDLDVEIVGISRWRATAEVAERFADGRIFIAGDAAHLMPPNGGFGGNTGIHDAHNLAWKLAHVLNGHASPRLLDTYESERQPVARFTVEQAFSRYVTRTAPWLQASHAIEPVAPDFDIEIGYLYGSPRGVHADPRETFGMPGSRAPHVWLTRPNGERVSTIDLTGKFLLLAGPEGGAWVEAAKAAAAGLGKLPLDAFAIGRDLGDPDGAFTAAYGIAKDGATLIRPDGFVAWRSDGASAEPERLVGEALKIALGH
jgi:2-polyprenyl-6-methoxyphenol hydroxylase-like FAD-dependent oxidoreductase